MEEIPFTMLPLHVCTENSVTQDTIIISQRWDRDARLHVCFQILLYRVCQERLLDFTMNWQRCRECVWACDSSDVHGPGRQPGSVLIASLPAPWLDRFPSRLIFQLSIDAAHSASSRPAPPCPLSIHTLAMRYFSTVPQALCPGYSLSCYRSPSRFSPQPSFSSPPSHHPSEGNQFWAIAICASISLNLSGCAIDLLKLDSSFATSPCVCSLCTAVDAWHETWRRRDADWLWWIRPSWAASSPSHGMVPTFDQLSPSNPNSPNFHPNHICPASFTQRSARSLIRFKGIFRMIKIMLIKGAIYKTNFNH